jgi:hypothetical protein
MGRKREAVERKGKNMFVKAKEMWRETIAMAKLQEELWKPVVSKEEARQNSVLWRSILDGRWLYLILFKDCLRTPKIMIGLYKEDQLKGGLLVIEVFEDANFWQDEVN